MPRPLFNTRLKETPEKWDNLVSSTGLIMWIGHRKEIRKLTFRALALRRSDEGLTLETSAFESLYGYYQPSWWNQIILLYFPPTQHTVSLGTYPSTWKMRLKSWPVTKASEISRSDQKNPRSTIFWVPFATPTYKKQQVLHFFIVLTFVL